MGSGIALSQKLPGQSLIYKLFLKSNFLSLFTRFKYVIKNDDIFQILLVFRLFNKLTQENPTGKKLIINIQLLNKLPDGKNGMIVKIIDKKRQVI